MENEIDWKAAALAAATPSSGGGRCGGPRRARGAYTRGLRLNKARGRYCYSTTCAHLEAQLADVRSLQHQLLAEADSLRLKEQVLLQAAACKADLLHSIVASQLDSDDDGSIGSFLVAHPTLLDQEVHILQQVLAQPHACSSVTAAAGAQPLPYTQQCMRAALTPPGGTSQGGALARASRARLGDVACEARQLALQMAVCLERSGKPGAGGASTADSDGAGIGAPMLRLQPATTATTEELLLATSVDAAVQQAMLLFAAGRAGLLSQLHSVNLDTLELVEQAMPAQQLSAPKVVQQLGLDLEQLQQLCIGYSALTASRAALVAKLQAALLRCTEQPEPASPVHVLAAARGWVPSSPTSNSISSSTSGHDSCGGGGSSSSSSGNSTASGLSSLTGVSYPMALAGAAALEQHEATAELDALLGRVELLAQDVWTLVFNTLSRWQIALLFRESWPWYPEPLSVCEHIASVCAVAGVCGS